jgi:hypothetical protein
MGTGACLLAIVISGWILPSSHALGLARRVASHVSSSRSVWMIDYKEPSLAFHQGGSIREQSDEQALSTVLPEGLPDRLVTTSRHWNEQPAHIRDQWETIATESGITLARPDRRVEVLILKRSDRPTTKNQR